MMSTHGESQGGQAQLAWGLRKLAVGRGSGWGEFRGAAQPQLELEYKAGEQKPSCGLHQ